MNLLPAPIRCWPLLRQHLPFRVAVRWIGGGLVTRIKGFPNSYVAPKSDYFTPTETDPNFETLKPNYVDPYWVASLEMDQWGTHRPDA